MNLAKMTIDQKIEAIHLLEAKQEKQKAVLYKTVFDSFYPWQKEFAAATKQYFECCLCAANQIGKTYLGTDIDAIHLLGDYPDDWEGYVFEFPPMCWALGYSMEKTRDLLQKALFGDIINGEFAGGLVPKDKIISWESATGTPNAMRTVRVKHTQGVSVIQFWSYSQGQHAIMGDIVDWFHIDEEPKDQKIRPQVLTRTVNGDRGRGGRGIYTFTPENGRTDLVIQFMDTPSEAQFFMQKGWVDAPHITAEKRIRILAQYPDHQKDMRSKGDPMLGHGRIYDIGDEFILCDPFEIPDHWNILDGIDFGWDHPQAHVQLAIDTDNGGVYVTRAYKARQTSPNDAWGATKQWSDGIPTAWPHDGLQHERGKDDALQQKALYAAAGFRMLPDMATWPEGGNSVENGLYELVNLMRRGQFKVFRGLIEVMEEIRQYHRDEKGHIVKVRDDLLCAIRYAYMMRRFAVRKGDINKPLQARMPRPIRPMGKR